jgi:hypothetical protein
MKTLLLKFFGITLMLILLAGYSTRVFSWPAAPLEGRQKNCLSCHLNTGPWDDEEKVIIEMRDPKTGTSFREGDGSFRIPVVSGGERRVQVVLGVEPTYAWIPKLTGWLFVHPEALQKESESSPKFAPKWEANRTYCGKRLGETVKGFEGKKVTAITMTIRPLKGAKYETAKYETILLQVLFKSGDRTKVGNYYERKVHLWPEF